MTLISNGLANAVPFRFTYADATARAAASGFTSADLYSFALQLDNGTMWILTATTPTWIAAAGSGMVNPMTTAGDIILGGSGGTPTRLAKGSNNTVLGVDGSGTLGYKADPTAGVGSYVPLHDETLAVDTSTLSYTPPSSGYRDLVVRIDGRTDEVAANSVIRLQVNADTGNNYDVLLYDLNYASGVVGTHTVVNDLGVASLRCGYLPGASATAAVGNTIKGELPDYLGTTFQKTWEADGSLKTGTSNGNLLMTWRRGYWRNTAAINALLFFIETSGRKFKVGTRFTVWGIKAS